MSSSEKNKSISVFLLTGYLGAGKTTLLNRILELPDFSGKKIVLIINEFGGIGIDGDMVRPGDYTKFEINKGSLFCICVKTDFIKTLGIIADEIRPDVILVEATGVAETRDLMAFVASPELRERFTVKANVCIIDAKNFTKVLPMLKAARSQAEWADALIINKTDLAGENDLEKLRELLRAMNPEAPMVCVTYGQIPAHFLTQLTHIPRDGEEIKTPPPAVFSASFKTDAPIRREEFLNTLKRLMPHILRLKGRLNFGDGPVFMEVVNDEILEKDITVGEKPGSAFVLIAWKMRQAKLESAIRQSWDRE